MFTALIVDDIPDNIYTLQELIRHNFEIEIIIALSGHEALKILKSEKVDLVLLDIQMPGISGFEVAELLSSNNDTKNIPIIFLTAIHDDVESVKRGYEIGAIDYIVKPIDDFLLVSKLKKYIQLHEAKRELVASEETYRGLINAMGHIVFVLDFGGRFLSIYNGYAELAFGYLKSELIGSHLSDIVVYETDEQNRQIDIYQAITIITSQERTQTIECGLRFYNGDSTPYQIMLSQGKYFGRSVVIGVAVDMTKQKVHEEYLNSLIKVEVEKRLSQEEMMIQQSKMAAMGEMIGNIAHQWRQPLNALGIGVQDVPAAYYAGELDSAYVDRFKNENMKIVKYMSQTIDDFRNFYRPDMEAEFFNLNEQVVKSYDLIKQAMQSYGICVDIEIDLDSSTIHGYPNAFSQAVLNIMNNAKDALVDKNIQNKHISVKINKIDCKCALVSISDNAGGVPQEIMKRIFEPYFTTKHKSQGTGLGLYMSKMIIENHMNGRLSVYNNMQGACFEIQLKCL